MKTIFNFSDCKNDIGSFQTFLIHKSIKKVKKKKDKHLNPFRTFILMPSVNHIETEVN